MRLTTSTIALAAGLAMTTAALAQDKVTLLYSDTVAEADVRSQLLKSAFGDCLGAVSPLNRTTVPPCSNRAPN